MKPTSESIYQGIVIVMNCFDEISAHPMTRVVNCARWLALSYQASVSGMDIYNNSSSPSFLLWNIYSLWLLHREQSAVPGPYYRLISLVNTESCSQVMNEYLSSYSAVSTLVPVL